MSSAPTSRSGSCRQTRRALGSPRHHKPPFQMLPSRRLRHPFRTRRRDRSKRRAIPRVRFRRSNGSWPVFAAKLRPLAGKRVLPSLNCCCSDPAVPLPPIDRLPPTARATISGGRLQPVTPGPVTSEVSCTIGSRWCEPCSDAQMGSRRLRQRYRPLQPRHRRHPRDANAGAARVAAAHHHGPPQSKQGMLRMPRASAQATAHRRAPQIDPTPNRRMPNKPPLRGSLPPATHAWFVRIRGGGDRRLGYSVWPPTRPCC